MAEINRHPDHPLPSDDTLNTELRQLLGGRETQIALLEARRRDHEGILRQLGIIERLLPIEDTDGWQFSIQQYPAHNISAPEQGLGRILLIAGQRTEDFGGQVWSAGYQFGETITPDNGLSDQEARIVATLLDEIVSSADLSYISSGGDRIMHIGEPSYTLWPRPVQLPRQLSSEQDIA